MADQDLQSVLENVELESWCAHCDGSGHVSLCGPEDEECKFCEGAGYIPTRAGKKVLALIRHHLQRVRRSNI